MAEPFDLDGPVLARSRAFVVLTTLQAVYGFTEQDPVIVAVDPFR